MSAPFRIEKPVKFLAGSNEGFKEYLSRLLKMIPGEIVGLYMIGSGFIPVNEQTGRIIWVILCFIFLIIIRIIGTSDPAAKKAAQPIPVFVAAIAFLIWIYWLGGPFSAYSWYKQWIGSLGVLVWSFLIPVIYKGQ